LKDISASWSTTTRTAIPRQGAGIVPGDLIVALDGQPVGYVAQLQAEGGLQKPGEQISVTVVRAGGVRKNFTVRLVAAPVADSEQVASANSGGGASRSTAQASRRWESRCRR